MAPREKKPIKSFDDDLKRKKNFFKQRFPGFKKKATELSVLCGNSVGFICYGPENDLHVWPEPQDNPQALPQIVAKFNAMSEQKRKNHACDLDDFPNLKNLLGDGLRIHLSKLDSHLVGIKKQKMAILKKTLKSSCDEDRTRVSETTAFSDQKLLKVGMDSDLKDLVSDDHLRVSDQKLGSWEDQSGTKLGFGCVFDELGYVVRGSTNLSENVSNFESKDACDPVTLGFSGGGYLQATELYQIPATYN